MWSVIAKMLNFYERNDIAKHINKLRIFFFNDFNKPREWNNIAVENVTTHFLPY